VVKPFSNIELIARVETAMRHKSDHTLGTGEGQSPAKETFTIDSTIIQPEDKA
jgi:DNA-binding response OmpR family regulator